jgi:hypothetical protein
MGMRIARPSPVPDRDASGDGQRFGYLTDKTFLAACFLYAANRFWGKPLLGDSLPFLRSHLDDCLLIPAALPPLLWLFRKLGLRANDSRPRLREVAEWTLVWSIAFEWAFPRFLHKGVADWRDVLAYTAGALVSWLLWRRGPRAAQTGQIQASAKSANIRPVRPFSIR